MIIGGLIFWSAITVVTALSARYSQLVICRGLEGLGEAFYFPDSMSMLSDYHGRDTRSRAMAIELLPARRATDAFVPVNGPSTLDS